MGSGGAEKTLLNLTTNDDKNFHHVITLKRENFYKSNLEKNNIKLYEFDFDKKNKLLEFIKLTLYLKKNKPDILQTWLYHSDLIGSVAGFIVGIDKIFWNIRSSLNKKLNLRNYIYYKILSILSNYIPVKIISCSIEACKQYKEIGYNKNKFFYIPNGIGNIKDHNKKKSSISADIINKIQNKFVICMIARLADQKNHFFLLKNFNDINKEFNDNLLLLLIGKNIKSKQFQDKIKNIIDLEKIICVDEVDNIIEYHSFIDLHVLTSSYGEGFPNVILETLFNKIPNISSDVGDSKYIIDNEDLVFKANDSNEFKTKIIKIIKKISNKDENFNNYINERSSKLSNQYSLNQMIKNYNEIWLMNK